MKPWFEKELAEADIIKFPEPEAKVVQMPNVQEYPDFITGVQDLQAKQKDGTISQKTYNKLYTDLIHRFMKKESFENPWYLREAKKDPLVNGSKRGEVNEHFLAVAIGAKFIAGDKNITDKAFGNVLKVVKNKNLENTEFKSLTKDKIIIRNIYKSEATKNDFLDPSTLKIMSSEIAGDVKFANSDAYTSRIAEFFAKNGKPDVVRVSAVGGEDEKGSKVDVNVDYIQPDGSVRRLRPISLKTSSGQMGQGSPKTLKGLQDFFYTLGVKIPDIKDYTADIQSNVITAFKQANSQLQKTLAGDQDNKEKAFLNQVVKFLDYHVTMNDPKVILVNIEKGDFQVLKIKNILKNVDNIDLNTKLLVGKSSDGTSLPKIKIYDTISGVELVEIRLKITGGKPSSTDPDVMRPKRFTLIVDVKPLFRELARSNKKKNIQTQQPAKPSPAPQQKLSTGNDGQRYRNYGAQWINDVTGRIATRDVAAYLDQNKHLQTPIPA